MVMDATVESELSYLQRLPLYEHEHPFQLFVPIKDDALDQRSDNLKFEAHRVQIADIRQSRTRFNLDDHGFQVVQWSTRIPPSSFKDRKTVETEYFKEVESLLRNTDPSIDRVSFFDYRLRSSEAPKDAAQQDMNDLASWLRPSDRVHVDQSPKAVLHRIQLHLEEDADFLLQGRVRVINAWRPLEHEVQDYPLAVCDGTTMPSDDLVPCDHIRRKFKGQTMYAHYSDGQKWFYLDRQRPEEVTLLKIFDSDPEMRATSCPHSAFRDPNCGETPLPRKSIEVRALVFNYPKDVAV